MGKEKYIHGYSDYEQGRLLSQGDSTAHFLYKYFDFSDVTHLLEPGVGVGAQSRHILKANPHLKITGIDFSAEQVRKAIENITRSGFDADRFTAREGDITALPFANNSEFDGAFFCWILEHLPEPEKALSEVIRVLQPGSPVFINETFNSNLYISPYPEHLMGFWKTQIRFELESKAHPDIGVFLGSILHGLGFEDIQMHSNTILLDKRSPKERSEFLGFWHGVMKSSLQTMIDSEYATEQEWSLVERDLDDLIQNPDTIFFYALLQYTARTPARVI